MPPKYKRKLIKFKEKLFPYLPLLAGLVLLLISVKATNDGIAWLREQGISSRFVNRLLRNEPEEVLKSYKGRTNFLLLGIAGGSHPGPDLSDTMIFVSYDLSSGDTLVASLPRDLWSPTLQDKINSAYHYGEVKKEGGGLILAKSIAEEVVGQPIHYAVVVSFAGFQQAIDAVGGIEIDVPESFIDKEFPIPGREEDLCDGDPDYECRYESVSFSKGKQLMDGETALKYVRSRNAEGRQGTDFARSQRQQQVILAFKRKVTGLGVLANPLKVRQLYSQYLKTVDTDLKLAEILAIIKAADGGKRQSLRKVTLDTGDEEQGREGWLYHPPVSRYGRWVLSPRTDSFDLIHELIVCYIESPDCRMQPEDY